MSVFRYIDTEVLEIRNSQFLLNSNAVAADADNLDIGFTGGYGSGGTLKYSGIFRDATDGIFKIFHALQEAPTESGTVNTSGTGYTKASMDLFTLHAFNNVNVDNDVTVGNNLTVTNDFVVNGSVTTFNVNTITVEDNLIVANSGPANVKEDAGFIIKRATSQVITDTPKIASTAANATGTTTTVELATQTSRLTDYYVGWVIKLTGDVTGTATILSSTSGVNPIATFDVAATGITTTSTFVELFNKRYVGTIWDESTDMVTFYGFPREDAMGVIDPAGDAADGNLADYIDTRARDAYMSRDTFISRDLYVEGVIKASVRIDDNIISVNAGPTNSEDAGYVVQRTATRVAAADTPKVAGALVQTIYVSGTTLLITNAAVGIDFYKGWVIVNSVDGNTVARTIVNSSDSAGTVTLTLDAGFPSGLAVTDTVNLYNKRFVGTIYDESTDVLMSVGFPREVGEGVIDPVSPVNGNVPDYVNVAVNDIQVFGSLNFTGGFLAHTITLTAAAVLTSSQVLLNDIIYLNPAGDATFTLPTIASMNFATNRSKIIMYVNISAFKITLQRASTDTIEGLTSLVLTKLYSKTVLTGSSEHLTFWTIKG